MNDEAATPGRDRTETNSGAIRQAIPPEMLGRAKIAPAGRFEAGSWASFTLTYTAGVYGIDDSGGLRVCFRFASDQADPQFTDPMGANYCTVEASNGAVLQLRFDPKGNIRPWDRTLWIKVVRGYLKEGDRITVRFGVTDHGGPGMRLQTFCEDTFEFRVLVDPVATFNFQPVPDQPQIAIVPGPPARYVAVLPTRRRPGERFALKLKGEDAWGNPSDRCDATFRLRAIGAIGGLPETVTFRPGRFAVDIDGLSAEVPGTVLVQLVDASGALAAETNPLVVENTPLVHYWGDIHGQSEETIGTGSARQYFAFARDRAFVDACAHQGNDFQITDAFWDELNRITAEFDEPGRFVALPGYEWSGNTALGGDRNVFFPEEGRIIRRSSHALIEDRATAEHDCTTAAELFEAFARAGEFDVVCFAHCGGRYADIELAHDGRFERSVEVHSSWGTFEWLLQDALRLGHRVGVVANSDGHKGRPGASYPGAGKFGAIGGLTCYLMEQLDRATLLDCLRKRRHYGTTGGPCGRPVIDLTARLSRPATLYHDDPALGPAEGHAATEALMGDIVHMPRASSSSMSQSPPTPRSSASRSSTARSWSRPSGLSARPISAPHPGALGGRRISWPRPRGRVGRPRPPRGQPADRGQPGELPEPRQDARPRRRQPRLARADDRQPGWLRRVLADRQAGRLHVETPLISFDLDVADIGLEDRLFDASGQLPRFIRVYRLPDANPHRRLSFSRPVPLRELGDNAIYIRLMQEDGPRAWTSPVYVFR